MKILYLTISDINDFQKEGLHSDLIRTLINEGNEVMTFSAKITGKMEVLSSLKNPIVKVKVGEIKGNSNLIKKGLNLALISFKFKKAIKKYCKEQNFDIVLYATPPINFNSVVKYAKRKFSCKSYLLLKDIFPQNAVDIGILNKKGIKKIIYKFFRHKEKELYKISDKIGCMSQANIDFLLKNNVYIQKDKVELFPNCIEIKTQTKISLVEKNQIRKKYGIPNDVKTFIYGGNLGRPQGISFIIDCLNANMNKDNLFFVLCGKGSDFKRLKDFIDKNKPSNILLINGLPKTEYDDLVNACDIGLIFLDNRFTIPNFPARLLSYLQKSKPVLAFTDANTDLGKIIKEEGIGDWAESNNVEKFTNLIELYSIMDTEEMGEKAFSFLRENYDILKHIYKITRILEE